MSTWPVPFASAQWGAGAEWDTGQAGVAPWTDPPQFCCHVEKLRPREVQAHGWAREPSWAPGGPGPSWPWCAGRSPGRKEGLGRGALGKGPHSFRATSAGVTSCRRRLERWRGRPPGRQPLDTLATPQAGVGM